MLGEFRTFLTRTNALALAIGVVIGTALGGVVTSLVNDIIMPPIGMLLGRVDFKALRIVLQDDPDPAKIVAINYGLFVNAVIAFVVVAFVVFWISRSLVREAPPAPPAPTKACPFCRSDNDPAATKCRACASAI